MSISSGFPKERYMTGLRTTEEEQRIWASKLEINELIKFTNYCIKAEGKCEICTAQGCKLREPTTR